MVDYDNAVLDSAKSLNSRYGNVEGIKCDVSGYDACVELGMAYAFGKICIGFQTDKRRFASGQNNLMLDYCMSYDIVHDWNGLEVLFRKYVIFQV